MTSAVAAVFLLATLTVVWAAAPNPCFRAQMPNDEDAYSFYKCDAGGSAHLWRCAAGTMYDRRTQICDWEDQVRARNGQTGAGGSGARPNNGGNRGEGGREGRETGAGGSEGGNGGRGNGAGGNNGRGNGAGGNNGRGNGAGGNNGRGNAAGGNNGRGNGAGGNNGRGNGRRPENRPANREPGPLDPDYDNGEDWGEMESWRDQFREAEGMSARERETPREGENAGGSDAGRNTPPANTPRFDCSARADGAGGAPRMYANPDDCATYFTCNMRRPVLTYCPRGLNFNPRRRGCDDSEPSNCRTVRTQTPNDVFIYQRRLVDANLDKSESESQEEISLSSQ